MLGVKQKERPSWNLQKKMCRSPSVEANTATANTTMTTAEECRARFADFAILILRGRISDKTLKQSGRMNERERERERYQKLLFLLVSFYEPVAGARVPRATNGL